MNKIHRWVSGMLIIGLLVSALSGCAALEALKALQGGDDENGTTQTDKDKLPDGSRDPSGSRPPSGGKQPGGGRDPAGGNDPSGLEDQADGEEIIPLEELSLEMLQEEIIQNGGSAGIAFIGYVDSQSTEADLREYVAYSYVGGERFFLQDADLVMTEGQELYAVVPPCPEGTVTVYASRMAEGGVYEDDTSTPLYKGKPGEAVIVLCNISEIYSNMLFSVTDGFGAVMFRPGLSGDDGHVVTEPGVYDFSIYVDEADEATIQRAQEKLMQLEGMSAAVQQGMTLLYGWTDYVAGYVCPVFALGGMDGELFDPQYYYAVADNGFIFVRTAQGDVWHTLGT